MTDRRPSVLLLLSGLLLIVAGCGEMSDEPEQRAQEPEERPAQRLLQQPDDPRPVSLPQDAAPHDRLTEWWYYTGHLEDAAGNVYGFEFVIFQARRAEFPPTYASHFAITDTSADEFRYAERVQSGEQPPSEEPVNLEVDGWYLSGGDGTDQIRASMEGYELGLELDAEKPPVLHDGDGYFQFAPAASSYYYSRTRMAAEGTLTIDGEDRDVSGSAWFDQQWGDFLMLAGAGWDWYSMQLDNGQELMAWQSHDRGGKTLDGSATIVRRDGEALDVQNQGLEIVPRAEWRSPRTGATYPMGWNLRLPEHDIDLHLEPVMEDQELVTVESTGQIYWEGLVEIEGDWEEQAVTGRGYVELTGYAPPVAESTLDTEPGSAYDRANK